MSDRQPPWSGTSSPLAGNDRGIDWILDRSVECASPDEAFDMASSAWRIQRRHVASASEFYQLKLGADALASIELSDLADLALTTKQELQEAQDEAPPYGPQLSTSAPISRRFETSGTSGRPTAIGLTDADVDTWMQGGTRSYHAMGVRPHNTVLSTFGPTPYVVGFTHDVITRIGAGLVAPGLRNIDGAIDTLTSGKIDTLLSTPSTALHLVERLAKAGIDPASLGVIHLILGGEPGAGPGAIRDRLEAQFGAIVTEAMGLGDISPSLFAECPAQEGMHFCGQGLVWPELIDGNGETVAIEAGTEGELVYTHLRREAMPLVRFRSRDQVRITTTSCSCGRTGFALRAVGRTDDMFIVRGINVYPSAVQMVVGEVAPEATGRVKLFRDAATRATEPPTRVEVELRGNAPGSEDLSARIAEAIHERLRFRTAVALVPLERFGPADYKTRLTTDEPPVPSGP